MEERIGGIVMLVNRLLPTRAAPLRLEFVRCRLAPVLTGLGLILGLVQLAGADTGTLVLECDAPCTILIDDEFIFRVEPDGPRSVEVEDGLHDVAALSAEAVGVMWQESIQVEEDEEQEVAIMIASEVELERDAEGPAEREFLGDRESRVEWSDYGSLLDPDTDLEWTYSDNHFDVDRPTAARYCATLRLGLQADDETEDSGWRLPEIDELEDIVDDDSDVKYKILGQFRLSGCCPWSADDHGTVSAWYMDFENGRRGFVTRDYTTGARVLCVREAP